MCGPPRGSGAELPPARSRGNRPTRRGKRCFWNPTKEKGRHGDRIQQLLGQLSKQITIMPLKHFPCVIKDSMCGPRQPEENRRSGGQVSPPPLLMSWRTLFHLWARAPGETVGPHRKWAARRRAPQSPAEEALVQLGQGD